MKTNELKELAREVGYGWAGWTVAVLSLTPFARAWRVAAIPPAVDGFATPTAPQPEGEPAVPATAPTPTRAIPLQVVTAPRVVSLPAWTVAPPAPRPAAPIATAGKVKPQTAPKPAPLTVPALRAEAKRRGLTGYSRLKRAELVALLA